METIAKPFIRPCGHGQVRFQKSTLPPPYLSFWIDLLLQRLHVELCIDDLLSNGIRFSISDLSPPTARSLPTIFSHRAGTSLFDAQFREGQKGLVPQDVIDEVIAAMLWFKSACTDFEVPETNVKVLATEAMRTARNSADLRAQIHQATGWEVEMLPKEVEGKLGAMGVASSFSSVHGLVMDLGGAFRLAVRRIVV